MVTTLIVCLMLLLVIFLVLTTVWTTLRVVKIKKSNQGRVIREEGVSKEEVAKDLLTKMGLKVEPVDRRYGYMTVDGEELRFWGKPDWWASRGNRVFIVEVKTKGSVKVTRAATRRQLLEYAVLYPEADAVLLVNMDERTVQEIEFPMLLREQVGDRDDVSCVRGEDSGH